MADYTWPNFPVTRFSMRVAPLTKMFASVYSNQQQTVDLLADCWVAQIDLAHNVTLATGTAMEAFFDRLKGSANRIIMPSLKLSLPQGTMRGSPVLQSSVAQLASTIVITTTAYASLLAGDMLGLGSGGQLVRVMANTVADGSGNMTVEVAPRIRTALSAGVAIVYVQPTAAWRLSSPGPAVDWRPGQFVAPSIELREDF